MWVDFIDFILVFIVVLCSFALVGLLIKLARGRRQRKKSRMIRHDLLTGEAKPVMETEGGKLYAQIINHNTCPDCERRGFYAGPSGGMSQNIYCKNQACRSAFNVTQFTATEGTVERIGKKDEAWYVGAAI